MAKIPSLEIESNPPSLFGFAQRVSKFANDLASILRNLTFSDNFACNVWNGSFLAGEEKLIAHPLKRIPIGMLVVLSEKGQIVKGPSFWTTDTISVKNLSVSDDENVRIIILG